MGMVCEKVLCASKMGELKMSDKSESGLDRIYRMHCMERVMSLLGSWNFVKLKISISGSFD